MLPCWPHITIFIQHHWSLKERNTLQSNALLPLGPGFAIFCVIQLLLPVMSLWLQRSHGDHSYWDVAAANFKHAIGLTCELVVEHVNSFIHSGKTCRWGQGELRYASEPLLFFYCGNVQVNCLWNRNFTAVRGKF